MRYDLVYSTAARTHLDRIAESYLEKSGLRAAKRIIDSLLSGFELLRDNPYLGPEHPDSYLSHEGYRKFVLKKYVGIYRIQEDTIFIVGIFHSSINYPALFR